MLIGVCAQIVTIGFERADLVAEIRIAIEAPGEEEGPFDLLSIEHLTYVRETVAELIAGENQGQDGPVELPSDDGAVRQGETIGLKKRETEKQELQNRRHGRVQE